MKHPAPWFSETRSGGGWFVKIHGKQTFLGKHPQGSPRPTKRNGRWNPPPDIMAEFHSIMAAKHPPSKDDYTLEEVFALYLDELGVSNPPLAERYSPVLGSFCDLVMKRGSQTGRRIGSLLVNAEADDTHLKAWIDQFGSDQTKRTYIGNVKTALNWAVKKKGLNITQNPFLSLPTPKTQSRAVIITQAEHDALLAHWENDCFCDFLQALWFTGARPGEIAKVEARHLKNGLWHLQPHEHKTGRVTGNDRAIGVCDELQSIVSRLMESHPDGPIFRNSEGSAWTTKAMFQRFAIGRRHKLIRTEVTPYAYRHAWATHALTVGNLDIYQVAKSLGHQTTQMVMLHYDHSRRNSEHIRELFNRARRPVNTNPADAS